MEKEVLNVAHYIRKEIGDISDKDMQALLLGVYIESIIKIGIPCFNTQFKANEDGSVECIGYNSEDEFENFLEEEQFFYEYANFVLQKINEFSLKEVVDNYLACGAISQALLREDKILDINEIYNHYIYGAAFPKYSSLNVSITERQEMFKAIEKSIILPIEVIRSIIERNFDVNTIALNVIKANADFIAQHYYKTEQNYTMIIKNSINDFGIVPIRLEKKYFKKELPTLPTKEMLNIFYDYDDLEDIIFDLDELIKQGIISYVNSLKFEWQRTPFMTVLMMERPDYREIEEERQKAVEEALKTKYVNNAMDIFY